MIYSGNPLSLSVAMCTYNGMPFLPEQVQSVLSQTMLPDEFVIVDDGSSDATASYLSETALKWGSLIYFEQNKQNMGTPANFEKAIGMCRGDVIVLSDQDDRWFPDKLRRIHECFQGSPDLDLYFSNAELIDCVGSRIPSNLWQSLGFPNAIESIAQCHDYFRLLVKGNVVTGATMAFRSRLRSLVLPIAAGCMHDSWISFMAACYGRRFFADPEPTIQYRVHNSQQIGVNIRNGLFDRICYAAAVSEKSLDGEVLRFNGARSVLADEFASNDPRLLAISDKLLHLQARSSLIRASFPQIGLLVNELCSRRYHRYSLGWRSFCIDFARPYLRWLLAK